MHPNLVGKPAKIGAIILTLSVIVFLALTATAEKALAAGFGSVKITVLVDGGSANSSQFTLQIKKVGFLNTGTLTASGNEITFSSLTPGTYAISVTGPAGYTPSWSGDCSTRGEVLVSTNQEAKCALVNIFAPPPPPPPPPPNEDDGGSDNGGSGSPRRDGSIRPAR